jgi:hypothetical protein
MNPLANIPDEQLTHELWIKSKAQAEAEKDWQIKEHSRPIILSELVNHYASAGDSIAASEKKARVSEEYRNCITELGKARSDLVLARARVSAVEYEIKIRINKSFKDRTEYNGGKLST